MLSTLLIVPARSSPLSATRHRHLRRSAGVDDRDAFLAQALENAKRQAQQGVEKIKVWLLYVPQNLVRHHRLGTLAGLSPGAGLGTAEEQAEAAYADLINASAGEEDLNAEAVAALNAGGQMDDASKVRLPATSREVPMGGVLKVHTCARYCATQAQRSSGPLGDVASLLRALAGGAHIVRQKDGRI